ncbi:MAG: two-component hybrid sensor and regulator [Bacteroidota bacterium]|nr:two-component hybrid sensor and regulator [Bacteroidota bacterium]
MQKSQFILLIWFSTVVCVVSTSNVYSQHGNEERFLLFFKAQNMGGKVNAYDSLSNEQKLKIYPLVKKELEKIREQARIDQKDGMLDRLTKIEAEIYYLNKNYSKSITLFTELLEGNKIKNYTDSVAVLFYLKNAYINLHSLNKAIEIHRQLIQLYKNHPDIDPWKLHPRLSVLYYEMKLYKESLSQQLLEFEDMKNNDMMKLGYYNNRGLFWQKFGQLDSAMFWYNVALDAYHEIYKGQKSDADLFSLGLIEGNIGQVLMEKGEFKKAIPLLEKDVKSSLRVKHNLNAAVSEIELANCYLNLNQFQKSKSYLDSAHYRLTQIEDYNAWLKLLKQFAFFYEKSGSYKLAIDYYNRYINFKVVRTFAKI